MGTAEVVGGEVNRHGGGVVLHLLGMAVREPREPAHAHAHSEVLALDERGRNVLGNRLAGDRVLLAADALGGGIALLAAGSARVNLLELGEIDVRAERVLYGADVCLQAVRGDLDAVGETAGEILDKLGVSGPCFSGPLKGYQSRRPWAP